jgi:hypothetical protein
VIGRIYGVGDGRFAVVATRKYSVTTSCHQTAARRWLKLEWVPCFDMEKYFADCESAGLKQGTPPGVVADALAGADGCAAIR